MWFVTVVCSGDNYIFFLLSVKFKEHHGEVVSRPTLDSATRAWRSGCVGSRPIRHRKCPFPPQGHFTCMAWGGTRGRSTTRETKISCYKLIGKEDRKKRNLSIPSLYSSGLWTLVVKERIQFYFIIKHFLDLARAELQRTFRDTIVLEFSRTFNNKPGKILSHLLAWLIDLTPRWHA